MAATNGRGRRRLGKAKEVLRTGVHRPDSDDELPPEDVDWQWIYKDGTTDGELNREIYGARCGSFICHLGDIVLLRTEKQGEAWVGLICEFVEAPMDDAEQEKEMSANFMWFSTEREIRDRPSKRDDALPNEIYITPSWDVNPLDSIVGRARVMSLSLYNQKHPSSSISRNSQELGRTFVCRRGCNIRAARYTEEFEWENIFQGRKDVANLMTFIKEETKKVPTKRRPRLFGEEPEKVSKSPAGPRTPSKKRKRTSTITPRKTPTSKYSTPHHQHITLKKQLTITPLSTRPLAFSDTASTPHQLARNTLHVSSVPDTLCCRDVEFGTVYAHLENAITEGTGACIYISGIPGTGKTATVREVVKQLHYAVQMDELDDFIFVEINGMKLTDPSQAYAVLWEALREERVSPNHALSLLEHDFSRPSPRRTPCVVLMDELDQLVTKTQSVVYNFFNWPQMRHSRLIVLAVANTMDLPERVLSNKISSRLGLTRVTFPGYNHEQLIEIVHNRLASAKVQSSDIIDDDAIQFAARKVAAVSGDARRCLDICRRAVEINEAQHLEQLESDTPATPSKSGRAHAAIATAKPAANVTIQTIKAAIKEATSSPLQQYLKALSAAAKVVLAALLAIMRRSGFHECQMLEVIAEIKKLLLLSSSDLAAHKMLLCIDRISAGQSKHYPRPQAIDQAVAELSDSGTIALEAGRTTGQRIGRVRLNVASEEVQLALQGDPDVAGMGC